MSQQPSARPLVRFGVFELDVTAGELRKQGRKINLQQQPFQVLALLLRRPGELVTREELQQALWPADTFVEFDQGLNTAIKKIRQALDDSADHSTFVETLPRKGYRFIAAVSNVASPAAPNAHSRRGLWLATAALVLAVAAAGAGWLLNKPAQNADAALVPVPLTSYPGRERVPSFSPDGNQVVFEWRHPDGLVEICVKLVGASEPLRLTQGSYPAWSPDGRSIAFLRFKPNSGVFLISPLGGPERKLIQMEFDVDSGLAWHPNGKWLLVTAGSSPAEANGLFAISLETGERRRLTSPADGYYDARPAVSPDGGAVVFSRSSDATPWNLYLLELSEDLQPRGQPKRITSENVDSNQPAWAPDGLSIVFSAGTRHTPSLYQMPLSQPGWRPGTPRLRAFAGRGVRTPAISRQGRLAYTEVILDADIWRLPLNGGRPASAPAERLIASTRLDHAPEYSPDGKRIVFASSRSGSHEIWVCDSDGANAMALTAIGGSFYTADPHWSPDGRVILFQSNTEGPAGTYAIDSDGGKPEIIIANSDVSSWSRDGKWIYFVADNQIWKKRWPISGNDDAAVPITRNGGGFARESPDGRFLYYHKGLDEITGLWRVPVEGGEETQILDSVCCQAFAVVDEGIYFIGFLEPWPAEYASIEYLSFATGKVETFARLSNRAAWGLFVSADSRWLLYSQFQPWEGDLWMVENFR